MSDAADRARIGTLVEMQGFGACPAGCLDCLAERIHRQAMTLAEQAYDLSLDALAAAHAEIARLTQERDELEARLHAPIKS